MIKNEEDGAESTRCERVKMKNPKDSVIEQESRPCKRRKILKTLSGVEHGIVFFGEEKYAWREASATSLKDSRPVRKSSIDRDETVHGTQCESILTFRSRKELVSGFIDWVKGSAYRYFSCELSDCDQ